MLFLGRKCSKRRVLIGVTIFIMMVYLCIIQTLPFSQRIPTIFCMISTIPLYHPTRAKAVKETWARHCDDFVFITTPHNSTFQPTWQFDYKTANRTALNQHWLWERIKGAFRRVTVEKMHFDWFLKADDDSFVIVENLREHLKPYNPNEAFYLGEIIRAAVPFASGGAGYVLSREAVKKFVLILDNGSICPMESLSEDVEMGKCLHGAGVKTIDAVDRDGSHRMLPLSLQELMDPKEKKNETRVGWLLRSSAKAWKVGVGCCSRRLISMHYITVPQMYMMYYLIYELQVGVNYSIDFSDDSIKERAVFVPARPSIRPVRLG